MPALLRCLRSRRLRAPLRTLAPALLALTCTLPASLSTAHAAPAWADALQADIDKLDKSSPGQLGVYVKRLDNGEVMSHGGDQRWYLGSSAKLPIAIAVLQEVEAGHVQLRQQFVLQDTDRTEASNLVWQPTGTRYPLDELVRRTLMDSDNTAANMLVRSIGLDTLNRRASAMLGNGFGQLTSLADVRFDVYAELHPAARQLRNMDLVKVAAAPIGPQRVETLRRTLNVERSALLVPTMQEAYARYYARNLNTTTLEAYGGMLEQLVRGKLLSPAHTQLLFKDLKYGQYNAYRLEAGLPHTGRFIHKTGTQFERACHMGVIEPQDGGRRAIVVAACAQGMDEHAVAGPLFEQVGRAITRALLQQPPYLQPAASAPTASQKAPG